MGWRNGGELQHEEDERRSISSSPLVNDALLLTTMCIIGLSVDVHIKDGSIYSGIFHTACVDDRYAIVLKQARMIKKGSCDSNVANEGVIGTLIIQSEDLVQVVAKRVLLPANGFAGHETGDDTGAVACSFPSNGNQLTEGNKTIPKKSNVDQPHASQTKCLSGTENGFPIHSSNLLEVNKNTDAKVSTKKEEALMDSDNNNNNNRKNGSHHSNGMKTENQKESIVSSSSTPTETVTSKIPNSNRTTKEFKLNPGAKIFSPSFPNKRPPTSPAIPAGTNLAYVPDGYPAVQVAAPPPEVEIGPYAPRSLPVKFVPYGNILSGNGGGDVQHPPPVLGYMANRAPPTRYVGQYHPVQTTPTFVQPGSPNVMVGRFGPVVYVHPVSQDMVPSTTSFSQVNTCSILTPHQVHVPKHQGTAAAQALQLCGGPPYIATAGGGQTPFMLPGHIPISQPPYPMIRPMPVPGSNGFLVSKFS
ncbi:hypothetical protein LXL04_037431 [Taraxacum kok-saghyz]